MGHLLPEHKHLLACLFPAPGTSRKFLKSFLRVHLHSLDSLLCFACNARGVLRDICTISFHWLAPCCLRAPARSCTAAAPRTAEQRALVAELASLNEDQRRAVSRVLLARDYALILGMPGAQSSVWSLPVASLGALCVVLVSPNDYRLLC